MPFHRRSVACLSTVLFLSTSLPTRAASSLQLYTVAPCRIVDTRNAPSPTGGPSLTQGVSRDFPITTYCGVPSTAKAAVINITMLSVTANGWVTVWQRGLPWPGVSNLNALAGDYAIANGATVALAGGTTDVSVLYGGASPGATTDLLIDVTGYFQ